MHLKVVRHDPDKAPDSSYGCRYSGSNRSGRTDRPHFPEFELVHYTIPLRRVRTSHVAFFMNPAPWVVHK